MWRQLHHKHSQAKSSISNFISRDRVGRYGFSSLYILYIYIYIYNDHLYCYLAHHLKMTWSKLPLAHWRHAVHYSPAARCLWHIFFAWPHAADQSAENVVGKLISSDLLNYWTSQIIRFRLLNYHCTQSETENSAMKCC